MKNESDSLCHKIRLAIIVLFLLCVVTVMTVLSNRPLEAVVEVDNVPRQVIYAPVPETTEAVVENELIEEVEDYIFGVCIYEDRYLSCADYLISLSDELSQIETTEIEKDSDNVFDKDFILFTTYVRNDGLTRKLPLSENTQRWVWKMCKKYELPYRIILGVLGTETTWNENPNHKEVHSGQTYIGIGCVSEKWHADTYEEKGINIYTLKGNIEALCDMIHKNYEIFHNIDIALMAYNMGANGARYQINHGIYETSYTRQVHFYADSLK